MHLPYIDSLKHQSGYQLKINFHNEKIVNMRLFSPLRGIMVGIQSFTAVFISVRYLDVHLLSGMQANICIHGYLYEKIPCS